VETVAAIKLADKLQHALKATEKTIEVMLQVNTSGEDSKSGIEPKDVAALARHVSERCPNLKVCGVMTIGALAHSRAPPAEGPNPDFTTLVAARKDAAEALNVAEDSLELSMGMSGDFAEATAAGSTSVRVGSSIFGARNYGGGQKDTNEDAAVKDVSEKLAKV